MRAVVVSAFRRTFRPAEAGHYISGPAKAGHYVLIALVSLFAAGSIVAAGENAFLDAAERGDRAAVLRLLAKGANPNVPGAGGTTAIMWAASNDDLELVRALIKAGADVKQIGRA